MTLRKLFAMCTNCNSRKSFKVIMNDKVDILPTLDGIEKYGNMRCIILLSMVEL